MNPQIKTAFILTLVFAAGALFLRSEYYADLTEKPEPVRVRSLSVEELARTAHTRPRFHLKEAEMYESWFSPRMSSERRREIELKMVFARIKYLELSQIITPEEAFRRRQDAEQAARLGMTITHGLETIPKAD